MESVDRKEIKQVGQTEFDQPVKGRNIIGIIGASTSVSVLFLCWVPILNWCLLFIGFVLSMLGLIKEPRHSGYGGIIASFFGLLFIITYFMKVHYGYLAASWGG